MNRVLVVVAAMSLAAVGCAVGVDEGTQEEAKTPRTPTRAFSGQIASEPEFTENAGGAVDSTEVQIDRPENAVMPPLPMPGE